MTPEEIRLPDGTVVSPKTIRRRPFSKNFVQRDLYTTLSGGLPNDEIERRLFGEIDRTGAHAVRAFTGTDIREWHKHFGKFFVYIDAQKIRTPKGLRWLRAHYHNPDQHELMREMQAVQRLHCALWAEGVREIVSAEDSAAKFIVTDHPVTTYNYACPPDSDECRFSSDPSIKWLGTQTLFALDKNHLLILTHYDYAKSPESVDPKEDRTNAKLMRASMVPTHAFIRTRKLNDHEVHAVNFVLKSRAARYVAAGRKDLLFPEKEVAVSWADVRKVLLPPTDELWHFGGEIYVEFKDGTTHYQDSYGRTVPENPYLRKDPPDPKCVGKEEPCPCGSGRPYEDCCQHKSKAQRPAWDQLSIRERNLGFIREVNRILGLDNGKSWEDVRRGFNETHVKRIHEIYEFFWPHYTDLFALLPKPDNELRALYSGVVDPRVIFSSATSIVPLFDQLLVQNPFINPARIRPEFSPKKSPHQHLTETLKNVYLLMILEPFIDAGFVNLFPDPCDFDFYLPQEMRRMAKERRSTEEIEEDDKELFRFFCRDDIGRSLLSLPRDARKSTLLKKYPEMSTENIEKVLDDMETMRKRDPLALLRDDLYSHQQGQFHIPNLIPNFELGMYVAQATGSIIVTHSSSRWRELEHARQNSVHTDGVSQALVSESIGNFVHRLTGDPYASFHQRLDGAYGQVRTAFRRLVLAARPVAGSIDDQDAREMVTELRAGFEKTTEEAGPPTEASFDTTLDWLLPQDGLAHNNVQRLLLMSGNDNHLKRVSMALRLVPQWPANEGDIL